jgi:hypothetical protein
VRGGHTQRLSRFDLLCSVQLLPWLLGRHWISRFPRRAGANRSCIVPSLGKARTARKVRLECAPDQHAGRFENMCNILPLSMASGLAIPCIVRGIEDGLRCAMTIDPQKSRCQEMLMKKYTKPCLKELGLLREVTKFSGCPTEAFCREA